MRGTGTVGSTCRATRSGGVQPDASVIGGRSVISLFSGAMGLDLGLEQAGFQTRVAVESDPNAVKTIRANRPGLPVIDTPIEGVSTAGILEKAGLDAGQVELIAGGPACQSFSTAGKRRSLGDQTGNLFLHFMRVVEEARPRFFLMENVRGVLSAAVKHRPLAERGGQYPPLRPEEELGSAFEEITQRLRDSGYYVVFDVLDAADYGTAQTRQRLVLLGSRDGVRVPIPPPSHSSDGTKGLPQSRTLREALDGLHEDQPEYLDFVPSQRDYFESVPPGGNWRDLPEHEMREAMGGAMISWGGRSGFFRRLAWDRPTPTLNTNPGSKATALCHPEHLRPLSVREYARVQEFPDDWIVHGSTRAKYRQLGNAVPVSLAAAIGRSVLRAFDQRGAKERLGRVECHNLDLLSALNRRKITQLNPPRMRGVETRAEVRRWRGDKPLLRNRAEAYTPPYLLGAVGRLKLVRKVLEKLMAAYGTPDLGNYSDPLDELFFILLSQRTTAPSYERVFVRFRDWLGSWETLAEKTATQVAEVIQEAGLSRQKAEHAVGIADKLRSEFGRVTLDPLLERSDAEVEMFLTSLPGVGAKTAKCVMLFGMGRQVLPVDTHVARVAARIGIVDPKASKSRTHEVLEAIIPPALRFDFHVNSVAHGRALCRAVDPACDTCPVKRQCRHDG